MKITQYLEILLNGEDLSCEQAKKLLDNIFTGNVEDSQIAAMLTAMRMKKIMPDELAGLAISLRKHAIKVETGIDNIIDTCGTGGAKLKTFNISTAAAFVAAGAGAFVAKHGNRGITSKCGSADVLEQMGVKIDCDTKTIAKAIQKAHIGFMFAPKHHPAMKFVQPIRKNLGFRTVFNLLGPMANPAGASAQLMGVAKPEMMETIADTLDMLGTKHVMVVHCEGMDEIGINQKTTVIEIKNKQKIKYQIDPKKFGIETQNINEIKGGDAKYNAEIIKNVLNGKNKGNAKKIVLLNASAAIVLAGVAENMENAFKKANEAIENGAATEALKKMIEITNEKK